ncbi:fumarylacetoacetate hydrolase family protein [Paenibacillus kobensis]|uniref:fumarylacetoacetate hydrolase family protein n=1 Tax=Paenibacillus kobensis TaxID=59841 RepID=UPI000FD9C076|nr:fumarylacetoacetate hydrolase family protein [Paenibacillus kobensis]
MKLLNFMKNGQVKLGVLTAAGVVDIEAAAQTFEIQVPSDIHELIEGGPAALAAASAVAAQAVEIRSDRYILPESTIQYAPSVTKPAKMICVGLNYRKHAEETNAPIPEYPILFNKFSNTLASHGDTVLLPKTSKEVDYEAELVIVIGKRAKDVPEEQALDYVFGYSNSNDLSARDLQMRTHQWMLGKCCDGFTPLGPYLVTADEIGDPNSLAIGCKVNGEVRQSSNTSDMIFNCKEIVSYISRHMTLEPGDIILTGTPEGVVLGYPVDKRVYLQDGDVVTIEIEKLGSLTVTMKQEV